MAVLFMDSFDLYSSKAQVIAAGWGSEHPTNIDFSTSSGRFGGGCLTYSGGTTGWVAPVLVAAGSTITIAAALFVNLTGGSAADVVILGQSSFSDNAFRLDVNASGDLSAYNRSGVQVGSTAVAALTDDSWHWFEMQVVIGTTISNGSIEVKINGTSVITATSIDTRGSNVPNVAHISFRGSSGDTRWDDIIIMDGTGVGMNGFIGDSKIDVLIPNSDSSPSDWTASAGSDFQCVDDGIGGSNDDTDYISSSTVGQVSEFQMSNFADNPTAVYCVQARARARKEDAGERTFRLYIESGATVDNGVEMGGTIGYSWRRNGVWNRNPNGSVVWNKNTVNALKVGAEIVS